MIRTGISDLHDEYLINKGDAVRIFNKFLGRYVRHEDTYSRNDDIEENK